MSNEANEPAPASGSTHQPESAPIEPTPRDRFIEFQREILDEVFALTSDEGRLRDSFERMALETYDHATAAGERIGPFRIQPGSAFHFTNRPASIRALVPSDLRQRWHDWKDEYRGLLERNPRLALYEMMGEIGETHTFSSWPLGLEPAIQDWIDKGERLPTPFDDRCDIVTPEFYAHLRDVRRRAGGFLLLSKTERRIVFLPEPEWQAYRAAKKRRAAERERAWRNEHAAKEQRQARLQALEAEIVGIARADERFWQALRAWEVAREAKRPADVRQIGWCDFSRSIVVVRSGSGPSVGDIERVNVSAGIVLLHSREGLSPEELQRFNNPPVDPLFTDLLLTVRRLADASGRASDLADIHERFWGPANETDRVPARRALRIVTLVREAVRRELGLDAMLRWQGGPSFAEA